MKEVFVFVLALVVLSLIVVIDGVIASYIPWLKSPIMVYFASFPILDFIRKHMEK